MVVASKVLMLKPGEFEIWRMRIEQYIQMIDYALWKVTENGLEILKENLSQEDINQKLLRSLSPEWNTHVVMWRYKVDLDTMSMDDLYNNLKVYEPEVKGMSSSSSKTQNMACMSSSNNNTNSTNRAVDNAQAVNTAHGVSTASTQVNAAYSTNIDNLSDVVICSFFSSQPNSPQLVHEDLKQIHLGDMEEMDLRWQMAMLTMRARRALRNQDNKHKESSRRSVPMETSTLTTLVSCDGLGGYDWSDQAKEGPNYALRAFSSLCSDRSMSYPSKTAHSTVKRPIPKNTTFKNYNVNQRDQRVIDSGCSRHMKGNMSYLIDYEEIDGGHVGFRGNPKGEKIIRKDHLGKFDGKADEGFFVRYYLNSKAFRVFNSRTRIVEENLHIRFSESTPNVVGSGPNWLFDIDALTRTINYKPIVAASNWTAASDVAPKSAPVNDAKPSINGGGLRWRSVINGGSQRRSPVANHQLKIHRVRTSQVVSEPFGELCLRRHFFHTRISFSASTDSLSPQVVSATKLPILNPNEFDLWKMRIEQYFLMTDYSLWEVILNGDSPAPTRVVEDKHQLKFNSHKDAKTLMEAIEKRFGGNTDTKKRNKTDLEEQSLDDLLNSLKIYEAEVKSFSSAGTTTQNIAFVSSSNTDSTTKPVSAATRHEEILKLMDLLLWVLICPRWSVITATGRDILQGSVGLPRIQEGMSFQAEEEATNYALIAFSSLSSSSDNEIDEDDMEEMDIKWNMVLLSMRAEGSREDKEEDKHARNRRRRV
nr:hypothetical protein [Tanacetum cinerariifolium]